MSDQIFSSLTNVMMILLIIQNSTPREFGSFALVFSVYVFALGLTRSVAGEPLSIRHSGAPSASHWRQATDAALGMAAVVGCLIGLVCIVLAPWLEDVLAKQILILGVFMPSLLIQDSLRYALFAKGFPKRAFMLDAGWALVLFVSFGIIIAGEASEGVGPYVIAWAASSIPATVYVLLDESVYPRLSHARRWFTDNRDLGIPYVGEFLATGGSIQVSIYSLGLFGGVSVVGVIRAVEVLLGPIRVLQMSVRMLLIPEAVRAFSKSGTQFIKMTGAATGGLVLATVIYGAFVLLLPDTIGRALLGSLWLNGQSILVPLVVQAAATAIMLGAIVGLRALAAARLSLRARLIAAPLPIMGGTMGVIVGGITGAAWGLALAGVASALVNVYYLQRALKKATGVGASAAAAAVGTTESHPALGAEHGSVTDFGAE